VNLFCERLKALIELRGRQQVERWQASARAGQVAEVFLELMHRHYDPGYEKSMQRSFADFARAQSLRMADGNPQTLAAAAQELLRTPPHH
ncbi:hypothetical protein ABTC25_18470, partial [Acinetobacter baumannii]